MLLIPLGARWTEAVHEVQPRRGYQSSGENVHGSDYCITDTDNYRPITNIEEEVREAMAGWMDSPGHRRNILRPRHRRVNIGLAWDRFNFKAVQQFEATTWSTKRSPRFLMMASWPCRGG